MRHSRLREYLRTHEVADALGVSLTTVYNWLRTGRIPEPERNQLSNYRLWTVGDVERIRNLISAEKAEIEP